MENMPLVSIVVPVYNVERYLRKCLDSLVQQTYRNIEIIIVNDGSTDQSANIIREYSQKDDRVKVVNKTNGGLASARNAGVSIATGEYVWNVDSDDYVELDSVNNAINLAISENSDIVVTAYTVADENYKISHVMEARFCGTISGKEALLLLLEHKIGGDVVGKFYRRRLYVDFCIIQNEEFSEIEDVMLNFQMFSVAKRVTAAIDFHCLNHIYRIGSYSSKAKTLNFRIKHHQGILAMSEYGFVSNDVKRAYYGYLFADFLTCISMKDLGLLNELHLTKIEILADYLQYSSSYRLLHKERSSKKIELLALGAKNSITRYISAFILRLYFESFKYRYSK